MNANQLKTRTKDFSIRILDLVEKLPRSISAKTIANQIVRSGTSVGANYRTACRARSDREFLSKMNIVLEESDETLFWLELIEAKQWIDESYLSILSNEANQLTAIFVSSIKTVNVRLSQSKI